MSSSDHRGAYSLFDSPSRRTFPSLAFADAMSIPFKSPLLPPSTTSSDFSLSSLSSASTTSTSSSDSCYSPATPPPSLSSSSFASCAYPDWPKRDILTPLSSFCGRQASSHISDGDLLDLEQLSLSHETRILAENTACIPWEATKQPPVIMQSSPVMEKARPIPKKRRRSSPLNRKKMVTGMSPIPEAPE